MPIISVRIPQLGEGLQEALLVEFLRNPGEHILRDEPIYVMETDKATTDVESPFSGVLLEWTVKPGTVLAIGSEIAKMEVADGAKEMPASHSPAGHSGFDNQPAGNMTASREVSLQEDHAIAAQETTDPVPDSRHDILVPPRTRKYLKDIGLLDQIDKIPVRGSKMMPEDVDAYVASNATVHSPETGAVGTGRHEEDSSSKPQEAYTIRPLPKSQITLNYRMTRGVGACIPVTVVSEIDWTAIAEARNGQESGRMHREREGSRNAPGSSSNSQEMVAKPPTGFAIACWAVVQAMKRHDKFRSVLTSDGTSLKVFSRVNLGIAVALPGDEMLTAVIRSADQMSASQFFHAYDCQVAAARQGQDQADETTTLTVSNIGKVGMRIGIPAIVAPAVATLALGEVFLFPVPHGDSFRFCPTVTATLSFDHRVVNGVGAANFLNDVRLAIEKASKDL